MVKVISLSEEAYKKLKAIKGNKSFSEVVVELTENKKKERKSLADFYGIWKDDSEWDEIKKELEETRKRFKMREVKW